MAITVSINEPTISVTSADSPSVNVNLTSSTLQVVESNSILTNTDGLPEGTYNKYYYTTRLLTDLQNIFDAGIQVNTLTVGTLNNVSENTIIHGSARVAETLYLGKPANYEQGIVVSAGTVGNAVLATDPTTRRLKWNYSTNGITSSAWYELPRTTDDLAEGSTNLYHTQERVEDTVANMVNGGVGLVTSYNDATGVLTISVDPTEGSTMTDLTLTGNLTTQNIVIPVDGDNSGVKRGIRGTAGTDDYWFIGSASTNTTGPGGSADGTAGYLEIATANNGTEPIYVRQYNTAGMPWDTAPSGTTRTLTLLDSSGNTQIPGTLQITGNVIKNSFGGSPITFGLGNQVGLAGNLNVGSGTAYIQNLLTANGGILTNTAGITANGVRIGINELGQNAYGTISVSENNPTDDFKIQGGASLRFQNDYIRIENDNQIPVAYIDTQNSQGYFTFGNASGTAAYQTAYNVKIDGTLCVTGDTTIGGNLFSTATTANVIDTTATTVNAFGAATTLNLGYDGTGSSTTYMAYSNIDSDSTRTIHIGRGGSGTTNIHIGNAVGSGGGGTTTFYNYASYPAGAVFQKQFNYSDTSNNPAQFQVNTSTRHGTPINLIKNYPSNVSAQNGDTLGIDFICETAPNDYNYTMRLEMELADASGASTDADFVLKMTQDDSSIYDVGAERFRIRSTGDVAVKRNITMEGDSIDIGSRSQIQAPTGISSNDTAVVILDSFAKTAYRTAKYIIQATTSSATHSAEAMVIHDGTDSQVTIYAELKSTIAGLWTNLTTTIAGSNVELSVTPASAAPTNFKVTKILMV